MFSEVLGYLGESPSAEKHVRKVLVMEACERPNTQDKVEDPVVFADMIATWHPPRMVERSPSGERRAQC